MASSELIPTFPHLSCPRIPDLDQFRASWVQGQRFLSQVLLTMTTFPCSHPTLSEHKSRRGYSRNGKQKVTAGSWGGSDQNYFWIKMNTPSSKQILISICMLCKPKKQKWIWSPQTLMQKKKLLKLKVMLELFCSQIHLSSSKNLKSMMELFKF